MYIIGYTKLVNLNKENASDRMSGQCCWFLYMILYEAWV